MKVEGAKAYCATTMLSKQYLRQQERPSRDRLYHDSRSCRPNVTVSDLGFVYHYHIMIHLDRARLLMVVPILCAFSLSAQTRFALVGSETVQRRLDLYKGNDSTREAALLKLFAQAGCPTASLSEQLVPHRKQPNIVCVLPGSTPEVIVVGAHFDHVPQGDGVVDNWSGASLLPSLFQSLNNSPRKHTFIFVAFSGEEEGLLGSAF
jgi:hypothetical protein